MLAATDLHLPAPGYVLHNGATVLQSRLHRHNGIVILAQWEHGSGKTEFVTWRASGQLQNQLHRDTSWGHYAGEDFAKATKDFADR